MGDCQTFTKIGALFQLSPATVVFALALFDMFTQNRGLDGVDQTEIVFYIFASIVITTKYLEDTEWLICSDYEKVNPSTEITDAELNRLLAAERKILNVVDWNLGMVEKVM